MKKNLESIFNVILGTAGHIDHGKSSLVQRLTGIDPDRLPEEKERGLTIDLGFSRLTLKNGMRVGIIDVPGHERLIKNMVAGASGIDVVLLVVAADDGVMPQTREHVAILELMGLERGIVAITKIDTVDGDLLELVREEIRETLAGTFLQEAPVVEVSSITGAGVDSLLDVLHEVIAALKPRDASGIFRMPIQRVFSAKGFGTVVTGVPVSGKTQPGEVLEVVPGAGKGRVRGIHAYGEPTDLARAGHSTAINLTDVDYRQVRRGMVLTQPGYFRASNMYEARLHYLPGNRRPLVHQTTIRLHVGTVEALGRVYLLDKKTVEPGEDAYVQIRLEEPAVAAPGDRFVLRLHSPLETIGGGEIIDLSRWRLKTGKSFVVEMIRSKEQALENPREWLVRAVETTGYDTVSEKDLAVRSGLPLDETQALLEEAIREGALRRASRPGLLLSVTRLESAEAQLLRHAEQFFRENPRRLYLDKIRVRQALGAGDVFFQDLIDHLASGGTVVEEAGGRLRFRDFGPRLEAGDEKLRTDVLSALEKAPFQPPSPGEIAEQAGRGPGDVQDILVLLEEEGEVLRLAEDVYFHRDAVNEAREKLRAHLLEHGTMTASDARQVLSSTRKFVIPLLEHLDKEGFTVRRGDLRSLKRT